MGGGISLFSKKALNKLAITSHSDVTHIGRNENMIVSIMMPVYYTEDALSKEELDGATACWQSILDDTAAQFLSQRCNPGFEYSTAMTFFFDTFYNRFFDIHPVSNFINGERM
jgi:hypothetical protein